jgi:hypothetical protein
MFSGVFMKFIWKSLESMEKLDISMEVKVLITVWCPGIEIFDGSMMS